MTNSGPSDDQQSGRRKIYLTENGHRYIKIEELFNDPVVKKRLESADRLAQKLGLKDADGSSERRSD